MAKRSVRYSPLPWFCDPGGMGGSAPKLYNSESAKGESRMGILEYTLLNPWFYAGFFTAHVVQKVGLDIHGWRKERREKERVDAIADEALADLLARQGFVQRKGGGWTWGANKPVDPPDPRCIF